MDNEKKMVMFSPCGHAFLCASCAEKVKIAGNCPFEMCGEKILQAIEIFRN